MNRLWSTALLGSLLLVPARASADGYESPSPGMLQSIRAEHGRNDWWFVSTDTVRFLVRIRGIDTQGLSGLKPKRSSERAPDVIAWSSIARIDERHSKFLAKSIQGALYGALVGGTLPFLFDETTEKKYAGKALLAGGVICGWLGGLHGDRITREDPIYVSRTLIAPKPVPQAPRPAERADSTIASGVPAAPPASVSEACRNIHPASRLRIQADFGTFDGHVDRATPEGLSGLRPHSQHGKMESIPGLVTWDRIQQIDRAGSAAASGARTGALVFGALGAMGGVFLNAVAVGLDGEPGGWAWIGIGLAGGAAGGALLGAGIGSAGTSWRPIYVP